MLTQIRQRITRLFHWISDIYRDWKFFIYNVVILNFMKDYGLSWKTKKILVIGMSESGKSLLIHQVVQNSYMFDDTLPSYVNEGFSTNIICKGTKFCFYEGYEQRKHGIKHQVDKKAIDAIIYVMDLTNVDAQESNELESFEFNGRPLIILGNKCDHPKAMKPDAFYERMLLYVSKEQILYCSVKRINPKFYEWLLNI